MEYAIFTSNIRSLKKHARDDLRIERIPEAWKNNKNKEAKFDVLYFGQEFCERLIPPTNHLEEALDFADKRKMKFSLVTPFVTEKGLNRWEELLKKLHQIKPDSEVIINDFGIFHLIREKYPGFKRVLGRLLTKQKRGPRILRLMGQVPDEMIDHFRRFNADVPRLSSFYRDLDFTRIELDNTLQGIERDSDIPASLYFPYVYVSTTRMCLSNQSDNRTESMRAIFPCKLECQHIRFNITHDEMPVTVTIAGNTQFIKNETLPEDPEKIHVDRLVYEPEIPL